MNVHVKLKKGIKATTIITEIKKFEGDTWLTNKYTVTVAEKKIPVITHLKANKCIETAYFRLDPNADNDSVLLRFYFWDENVKKQEIEDKYKKYIHDTYVSEVIQFLLTGYEAKIESITIK